VTAECRPDSSPARGGGGWGEADDGRLAAAASPHPDPPPQAGERARKRFRAPRRIGPALAGVLLALFLWGGGFLWFVHALPSGVADPDSTTDAIVVLTGGRLRIDEGLALHARGRAKWLFVSGVHPGVTVAELLRVAPEARGEQPCCIELGYAAADTLGNAQETAAWLHEHHFRSLRLVTAGYHMPRALLELRRAAPEAVIVPHPVFPERVRQADWWAWPGSAWLIASEYNKYLGALLRGLAQPAPAEAAVS
jgi:uncharacterized SAM-binding protein YcdF (DUF218 family)